MKSFEEQQKRLWNVCNRCNHQGVNYTGDTFCPFVDEYCIDITEEQMRNIEHCLIHNNMKGLNNGRRI